jgi:hypothetical protein
MLEQVEIPDAIESFQRKEKDRAADISVLEKGMAELERLYMEQKMAAEDYAASVKAIAETSGLKPAVIRKVVQAKCDATLEDTRYEAEQLSMALEVVGG